MAPTDPTPTLPDAQLEALARLAADATPGPWIVKVDGEGFHCVATERDNMTWWIAEATRFSPNDDTGEKHARFIAACDPTTVAALVALARRGAADSARLDWLQREAPVRIAYEDEGFESDRIELVSEHGGINDRQFTSVGVGRDLRAAVDAARSALPERTENAEK